MARDLASTPKRAKTDTLNATTAFEAGEGMSTLFATEAPSRMLDESSFAWDDQSEATCDQQGQEETVVLGQDVWDQVRQATRSVLGETSAVMKRAASPEKPRRSVKEKPPLVPSRHHTLDAAAWPSATKKKATPIDHAHKPSPTSKGHSGQQQSNRRQTTLGTSTSALQPPRSAMKRQTTLGKSAASRKSVAFASSAPDQTDAASDDGARSSDHDAQQPHPKPSASVPSKRSVDARSRGSAVALRASTHLVTAQPEESVYLDFATASLAHRDVQDHPSRNIFRTTSTPRKSALPSSPGANLSRDLKESSMPTSSSPPARENSSAAPQSHTAAAPLAENTIEHGKASTSLTLAPNASSESSGSMLSQHMSIADLSASVARHTAKLKRSREALARAMAASKSLQDPQVDDAHQLDLEHFPHPSQSQDEDGEDVSVPPAEAEAQITTAADRAPIGEASAEPVQQEPDSSRHAASRREISLSRKRSRAPSISAPAGNQDPAADVNASHAHHSSQERSWSEPSFVERQLPPDDMFARRMRDSYLLNGLDFSQPTPGLMHSVTGFPAPPRPIVRLPPAAASAQASRAVRPLSKIGDGQHDPGLVTSQPPKFKKKAGPLNLTLPREFVFSDRTRPPRPRTSEHTRPSKRQKIGTAAFAPVETGRATKQAEAPRRDINQQQSASHGSAATNVPLQFGHRETATTLTASALQTQPAEDRNSQVDERLRRFFSSTQGEVPDFSSVAKEMPAVSLPPSAAARAEQDATQTQPQDGALRMKAPEHPAVHVLQNKTNHPRSGSMASNGQAASHLKSLKNDKALPHQAPGKQKASTVPSGPQKPPSARSRARQEPKPFSFATTRRQRN